MTVAIIHKPRFVFTDTHGASVEANAAFRLKRAARSAGLDLAGGIVGVFSDEDDKAAMAWAEAEFAGTGVRTISHRPHPSTIAPCPPPLPSRENWPAAAMRSDIDAV